MVNLPSHHKRLHKALACVLKSDHFFNRLVSFDTAEAILNQLAPKDKQLPKAYLQNGALNKTGAIYMLEDALKHHHVSVQKDSVMVICGGFRPKGQPRFYAVGVFSSIEAIPDDKAVRDLHNKGGVRGREMVSQK
jgi:hypothetical protein